MIVSELKLLLTRIPDTAEVTVNYAGEILGVEKLTMTLPQVSVEIDTNKTWAEQTAPHIQATLTVKEKGETRVAVVHTAKP